VLKEKIMKVTHELWVCTDCMLVHANGESPERGSEEPETWAIWKGDERLHGLAMGGEHVEDCPNGPEGPRDADCDCETREFDRSPCDGCGSNLHGTRHAFVILA
jgi:hypothetical protein